jgi:hypothetical protein
MPIKFVSMWRTSPTQIEHFRALYMSQEREEVVHIQGIRRLCGLLIHANRKIADFERPIAELMIHRHPDVKPPLPTESHSISAIFLSEFIENSTIDRLRSEILYQTLGCFRTSDNPLKSQILRTGEANRIPYS